MNATLSRSRSSLIALFRSDSRIATRYALALRAANIKGKLGEFADAAELLDDVADYLERGETEDPYAFTEEELTVVAESLKYANAISALFVSEIETHAKDGGS